MKEFQGFSLFRIDSSYKSILIKQHIGRTVTLEMPSAIDDLWNQNYITLITEATEVTSQVSRIKINCSGRRSKWKNIKLNHKFNYQFNLSTSA